MGFNGISNRTLFILIIISWAILVESQEFSYGDGPTGPMYWGNLSSDWWLCGSGQSQSPIDISTKKLQTLDEDSLQRNYTSGPAELKLGHYSIAVEWEENGGAVYWNEEEYKILEYHVHSPSEHTINGERFPLEAHIVHEGANGNLLVISILYRYGNNNSFMSKVFRDVSSLVVAGKNEQHIQDISMSAIKFGGKYYHYLGSLTTPPCSEGVKWIVMKKKYSVSHEQVNMILDAQGGENARPEQSLNNRTIYKHT